MNRSDGYNAKLEINNSAKETLCVTIELQGNFEGKKFEVLHSPDPSRP